jgi:hypothetical protein
MATTKANVTIGATQKFHHIPGMFRHSMRENSHDLQVRALLLDEASVILGDSPHPGSSVSGGRVRLVAVELKVF